MPYPTWDSVRPTPQPLNTEIETVWFIGDSLAEHIASKFLEVCAWYPEAPVPEVTNYAIGATSISRGTADVDWQVHLESLISDPPYPDVIVAQFLGGAGVLNESIQRSKVLIDMCRDQEIPVAWCVPPLIQSVPANAVGDANVAAYSAAVLSTLSKATWRPNVKAVLCPGGAYSPGLNLTGIDLPTRLPDGIHLTDFGALAAADAIRSALA